MSEHPLQNCSHIIIAYLGFQRLSRLCVKQYRIKSGNEPNNSAIVCTVNNRKADLLVLKIPYMHFGRKKEDVSFKTHPGSRPNGFINVVNRTTRYGKW